MDKTLIVNTLYLAVFWYLSKYVIAFIAFNSKKENKEEQEANYRAWNIIRHVICGFILIIFVSNALFD